MLGIVTIIFFAINRAIRSHAVAQLQSIYGIYLSTRFSIRASTNLKRHAIVTYFNSIDELKDVNLCKSLAALMKHSVLIKKQCIATRLTTKETKAGRSLILTNSGRP
jgi:hypothetical protein